MDRRPPTSFWLVPAEPQRAELRLRIDRLALEHGTPSFEPHVTLASGQVDHEAVLAAVERIAADWAPIEAVAGATSHGPDRFKAVFVELADPGLPELAAALCAEVGLEFDRRELQPHVSLVYAAGLPPATRASIAAANALDGTPLRFDTLAASVPGAGVDDVSRWQTPVARRLAGIRSTPRR